MNRIIISPYTTQKTSYNNYQLSSKKYVSFSQKNDYDRFDKPKYSMPQDIRTDLNSLASSYNHIVSILDKKTGEGVKSLITESGLFNTIDGITLKNIGPDKDNISFEAGNFKNHTNTIRITQRTTDGKIKNGWLIKDGRVIKNYNPQEPNSLSNNLEFYTLEELEESGTNKDLRDIISNIDPVMLKVRLLVLSKKDTHLKPIAAELSSKASDSISDIVRLTETVKERAEKIPQSTLYKMNLKFPKYKQTSGQSTYTFKDLGQNNEQINYSTIESNKFGYLQRLMVYNQDGSIKTGYLIKDNNIISNFNPKCPTILPEKLYFADTKEIKTTHYSTELENYLDLYSQELQNYLKHITPDNTPGSLSDEHRDLMNTIDTSFKSVENLFSKLNNVQIYKIKLAYPDYLNMPGKRGYTFANVGPDKEKVNIMRCNSKHNDNLIKISVLDDMGETRDYLLIQNDKVVSNYNPKYPTMIPNILKFYNQQDLYELTALKYLEPLNEKMADFKNFVDNTIEQDKKDREEAKRLKEEEKAKKQLEKEKLKQEQKAERAMHNYQSIDEKIIAQRKKEQELAFNELLASCKKDFKDAFDNIKQTKDPTSFLAALESIKDRVEAHFKSQNHD